MRIDLKRATQLLLLFLFLLYSSSFTAFAKTPWQAFSFLDDPKKACERLYVLDEKGLHTPKLNKEPLLAALQCGDILKHLEKLYWAQIQLWKLKREEFDWESRLTLNNTLLDRMFVSCWYLAGRPFVQRFFRDISLPKSVLEMLEKQKLNKILKKKKTWHFCILNGPIEKPVRSLGYKLFDFLIVKSMARHLEICSPFDTLKSQRHPVWSFIVKNNEDSTDWDSLQKSLTNSGFNYDEKNSRLSLLSPVIVITSRGGRTQSAVNVQIWRTSTKQIEKNGPWCPQKTVFCKSVKSYKYDWNKNDWPNDAPREAICLRLKFEVL